MYNLQAHIQIDFHSFIPFKFNISLVNENSVKLNSCLTYYIVIQESSKRTNIKTRQHTEYTKYSPAVSYLQGYKHSPKRTKDPKILQTLLGLPQTGPSRHNLILLPFFSRLKHRELLLQLPRLLFQLLDLLLQLAFLQLVARDLTVELLSPSHELRLFILDSEKARHAGPYGLNLKPMRLQLSECLEYVIHGALWVVKLQLAGCLDSTREVDHEAYGKAFAHALLDAFERLEMGVLRANWSLQMAGFGARLKFGFGFLGDFRWPPSALLHHLPPVKARKQRKLMNLLDPSTVDGDCILFPPIHFESGWSSSSMLGASESLSTPGVGITSADFPPETSAESTMPYKDVTQNNETQQAKSRRRDLQFSSPMKDYQMRDPLLHFVYQEFPHYLLKLD
ncbi:E3 ubiquitin-protein ligase SMURF2 [Striga asiatica]|uniref:E3 ubiquitin-protein ligase SMURF2 n=1 Tax=Striga asiatica TaxID=4170 RepID=A0A5A7QD24_STRAF|nr:E3 ubiquitin-protein ligase SMURF2 [Striga asiatica]